MQAFNFNIPLVNYADEPFTQLENGKPVELNAGKILAFNLGAITKSEKGDIFKLDDWGKTLYKGDALILDAADKEKLTTLIQTAFDGMAIRIRRQLLDILKEGKEVKPTL